MVGAICSCHCASVEPRKKKTRGKLTNRMSKLQNYRFAKSFEGVLIGNKSFGKVSKRACDGFGRNLKSDLFKFVSKLVIT